MLEQQTNLKAIQDSAHFVVDASGQSYIINSSKSQIKKFNRSGTQIGIFRAEAIKSPMAIVTVDRYFWIVDTGNNRILLLKAPQLSSLKN